MLPSVNRDLASSQTQSTPNHAVWGDLRRTAYSYLRDLGLAVLLLVTASSLALGGSKLSNDLRAVKSTGDIEVLVQFKRIPTDDDLKPFAAQQIKHRFQHVRAVHLKLPLAAVQALESNPMVAYVTPNRSLKGALDITVQTVKANQVWQTLHLDGTGVGVAVIDSGIYLHPDLKTANGLSSRVVYSQNFLPGLDASDQ